MNDALIDVTEELKGSYLLHDVGGLTILNVVYRLYY